MVDAPTLRTVAASDGYAFQVATWPGQGPTRGRVVVLHGVQSHEGWYRGLGRTLAESGYETHFPDRRGSGANLVDRGHADSARRLLDDVVEVLQPLRASNPPRPTALAGISWGGKLAAIVAGEHPELVDALALIAPGLHPRVGVPIPDRLRIAMAYFLDRRRRFPIPLADPALFTASPEGQAFIADDPHSIRDATAGLLAASVFIDRMVRRMPPRIKQPSLLMLAGRDRIVDNAKTFAYFAADAARDRTTIIYPEAHHTLEFEPDPTRYARDLIAWLDLRFPTP